MGRLSASTVMEHMIAVMRRVSELAPADGSQGRPVSVMRIARDLGLEPARVRDSIRMLNECGATLADSADGAAFAPFVDYDEAHDLVTPLRLNLALDRTIGLTPREARALLTMFDLARIGEDDPLARKIRGAIPRLTASVVDGIEAREASESPAVLLAVVDAIRERQTLVISYQGAQDDHPRERYVRPLRLTYDVDATNWYAYCWCLDAEGYRNFRLDRIATAGVAPEEAAAGERDAADAPVTPGASGARAVGLRAVSPRPSAVGPRAASLCRGFRPLIQPGTWHPPRPASRPSSPDNCAPPARGGSSRAPARLRAA